MAEVEETIGGQRLARPKHARGNIHLFRSKKGMDEEGRSGMRQRSMSAFSVVRGNGYVKRLLTPPAASLTTSTNEPRLGNPGSVHLLYRVARLTPSFSRLYTKDQVSANCSLGGTNNRISSAKARDSICADSDEPSGIPARESGVRGGG